MTSLRDQSYADVVADSRMIAAMTDREIGEVAIANHDRALEVVRLAESNYANIVPWRYGRWLRIHREVQQINREIRAVSAAVRAERARRDEIALAEGVFR